VSDIIENEQFKPLIISAFLHDRKGTFFLNTGWVKKMLPAKFVINPTFFIEKSPNFNHIIFNQFKNCW